MGNRVSIKRTEPEAYQAMMALENYGQTTQLDPKLRELMKIRASQINGCSYCTEMHTELAIRHGESESRISALESWARSPLFSDKEKAVFRLTEELTRLSVTRELSDETYDRVVSFFEEKVTAQIIMLIVLINSWNRIAVSTKMIFKK